MLKIIVFMKLKADKAMQLKLCQIRIKIRKNKIKIIKN